MDFVALVIAALALAFTAWSAHQKREHDRLSVRPKLHLFHSFGGDEDRRGVCLRNVGLGPAQITSVDVLFDDQPFAQTIAEWNRVLSETPLGKEDGWLFNSLHPGAVLDRNESFWILFTDTEAVEGGDAYEALSATFSRLAIRISYECMYERSQPELRSSFLRVPE